MARHLRYLILAVAFLGWFFGGMQIGITGLAMRPAAIDLMAQVGTLDREQFDALNARAGASPESLTEAENRQLTAWNADAARWFGWFQCAFLFGAAGGGFLFGRLGDRLGRTKALALSIFAFAALTGISYFVESPGQLLLLRFLACIGIGGTWPNGVALVSEVWPSAARPIVAGSIGMAGNLGIFVLFTLGAYYSVTPDSWRWVMWVGAVPVFLGLVIWFFVPESPRWLEEQRAKDRPPHHRVDSSQTWTVFRPPYTGVTLVGIALATIPLIGGWGSANWMLPWADQVGSMAETPDPYLKAHIGQARSLTSIVGSLFGGVLASLVGRRRCYFVTSLGALLVAQYAFWFTVPTDAGFLWWVAFLGFFNGVFFGWLPFFLPELFPTAIRSTGAGVSFNFGRILTAVTIFLTAMLKDQFASDYAQIGRVTSLVFAFGMIAILFAPDTTKKQIE